jgi:hypothetical protein
MSVIAAMDAQSEYSDSATEKVASIKPNSMYWI